MANLSLSFYKSGVLFDSFNTISCTITKKKANNFCHLFKYYCKNENVEIHFFIA